MVSDMEKIYPPWSAKNVKMIEEKNTIQKKDEN
jgi:hypothetical protein